MAGTRLRSTKVRTVHDRWWRSQRFWAWVLLLLMVAVIVVATILDPNGGGRGG
jgi:hypothetical protein